MNEEEEHTKKESYVWCVTTFCFFVRGGELLRKKKSSRREKKRKRHIKFSSSSRRQNIFWQEFVKKQHTSFLHTHIIDIYWFSCDFPVNFLWPQKPFWTPKRCEFGLVELVRKRLENSRLKLIPWHPKWLFDELFYFSPTKRQIKVRNRHFVSLREPY